MTFLAEKAVKAQLTLSGLVKLSGIRASEVALVAGLDVAYGCGMAFGAAALFSTKEGRTLEVKVHPVKEQVPYVPGFLGFREVGAMASAYLRLTAKPDAVLVDGHGIAHPRRFGSASHFGVVMGVPSVGVAKRVLYGREEKGFILIEDERVAAVIGQGRRRIFVSPGHMISLEESINLVKSLLLGHRLPEPLFRAHAAATAAARSC